MRTTDSGARDRLHPPGDPSGRRRADTVVMVTEAATVTISTPLGAIRGLDHGSISVFRGIRYATAERFAPPVRTGAWDGVLDATAPVTTS